MQYGLIYTPRALRNLRGLRRYLTARFSARGADRFEQRITDRCERIRQMPFQGTQRDALGTGVRTVGMTHQVTVPFRIEGNTVRVVSVSYGGRRLEPALPK